MEKARRLAEISAAARALLESEQEMGWEQVALVAKAAPAKIVSKQATDGPVAAGLDPGEKRARLRALAKEASECRACELHQGRRGSVFARGSADAELLFVGEGPGRDEDLQGLPFVGQAGQLLDRMIAAMGYERDEVYICNVVKCRPPENRRPLAGEAIACERFLTAQLELVAPKVIVALGKCAAENLGISIETSGWRGKWTQWRNIPMIATYHPAFLLYSPQYKRVVWEDLQKVMERLGRVSRKK